MKQRNTKTKDELERLLRSSAAPVALETLWEAAKKKFPSIAYSTVYRIVKSYEGLGKVHAVEWRERGNRYEWSEKPHHHHLVCEECSKVIDIEDKDLQYNDAQLVEKTGFKITHHSIELFGTCQSCQEGKRT